MNRRALNPLYSRNAFARDLRISAAALSQFLSDKRCLSKQNTRKVCQSLCIPPGSLDGLNLKKGKSRNLGEFIDLELFAVISDWHHLAILNLVSVRRIRKFQEISVQLCISEEDSRTAVLRLLKLGMLGRDNGFLVRKNNPVDTSSDLPSAALRKHNRQKLELAIAALEKTPIELRDISSLTFSINHSCIDKFKDEISGFKRRISRLVDRNPGADVYSLNVQLFPLSKFQEKGETHEN